MALDPMQTVVFVYGDTNFLRAACEIVSGSGCLNHIEWASSLESFETRESGPETTAYALVQGSHPGSGTVAATLTAEHTPTVYHAPHTEVMFGVDGGYLVGVTKLAPGFVAEALYIIRKREDVKTYYHLTVQEGAVGHA